MIVGYFGRQRSGKTTFLANYVRENDKKVKINNFLKNKLHFKRDLLPTYSEIYSTDYIRNTIQIRPSDIGAFIPKEGSLFLLPEAGTYFNNRRSAQIPKYTIDFFSDCSHMNVSIIWDSQTVNVDKILRERSWKLYIVRRFSHWSFTQHIRYKIDVLEETRKPDDIYKKPGFFGQLLDLIFFQNKILYRPLCYDYFDSYSVDKSRYTYPDDSHLHKWSDNGVRHSWWKKHKPLFIVLRNLILVILAVFLLITMLLR